MFDTVHRKYSLSPFKNPGRNISGESLACEKVKFAVTYTVGVVNMAN